MLGSMAWWPRESGLSLLVGGGVGIAAERLADQNHGECVPPYDCGLVVCALIPAFILRICRCSSKETAS